MKKKCPVCLCDVNAKDSVCNFCKTPLAKSVGTSDLSNAFKPPTVVFDKKITSNSVKIPTEIYNAIASEIENSNPLPPPPPQSIEPEVTETKITFESIKELTQNKKTIETEKKTEQNFTSIDSVEDKKRSINPKLGESTENESNKEVSSNTYKIPREILTTTQPPTKSTIEKKQEIKFDDIETPLKKFDFEHHLKEESQEQKTGKLINFERIITQIKALERTNQISGPVTKDMLTSTKPRNFLQDTFDIKLDALGFVEEELDFKDLKKHMKVSLDRESSDKQAEREQSKKEELKRKHFEVLKRIMRERKKKYSLKLISTSPYYIAPFEIENLEIEEIKKDKNPQGQIEVNEEDRNLEIETTTSSNEIDFNTQEEKSFLEVEDNNKEEEAYSNLETPNFNENNLEEKSCTYESLEEVEQEIHKESFFIPEDIINTISTRDDKSYVETFEEHSTNEQEESNNNIETSNFNEEMNTIRDEVIEKNTVSETEIEIKIEEISDEIDINEEVKFNNTKEIESEIAEEEKEVETDHLESISPVSFDINVKSDESLIGSIFTYDAQKTLDIFVPIDKNIIFETQSLSDLISEEKSADITKNNEDRENTIESIQLVKENLNITIETVAKVEDEEIKTDLNTESSVKEAENIELTLEPLKNPKSDIKEEKNSFEESVQQNISEIINEPIENKNDVLPKVEVEEENNDLKQVIKNRLKRLSKKPTNEKTEPIDSKLDTEIKKEEPVEENKSKETIGYFETKVENQKDEETNKTRSNEADSKPTEIGLVRYKADEKMEVKVLEAIKAEEKTEIQLKETSCNNNIRTTLNTTNASLMNQIQGARGSNNKEALQYYNIARDLCVKNNYLLALTQLELAVKTDPAFEQAHILLSRTYLKLKSSGHIEIKI